MKFLFKKFWLLIFFNILIGVPIWIFCAYRTNKYLILKGDTTKFESVIDIETDNIEKGSFSTIYVISFDKSTIFQNFITKNNPKIESGELSIAEASISDIDSYKASKIQYYSSIEKSLILAYTEAKKEDPSINIDYSFYSFDVTYIPLESSFKIGDRIIGINDINNSSRNELLNGLRNMKLGDKVKVIRDDIETFITINDLNGLSVYERYNINKENTYPKYEFKDNYIGGPSGGLLQTLSIYNRLTKEDLTHGLKIAGTGTISINGDVGLIGGVREKVPTAIDDDIDIFFVAAGNYDDALESYNSIINRNKMKLVKIETFYDCLNYLKEGYKNDFKGL